MTKTFCDRCEKEMDFKENYICVDFNRYSNHYYSKVFCERCFTALESFLNNK